MNDLINTEIMETYLKENNLNKTKFCKKCNISLEVFNKIMANQTNFRINALLKIGREMKVELKDLFKK